MCFLDVSCFSSISNPSCNASLVVHSHRMCLCGGSVLPKCQARSKEIVEQKDRWDLPNRSLAYQWLSCCPVIFQTDPDRGGGVNFSFWRRCVEICCLQLKTIPTSCDLSPLSHQLNRRNLDTPGRRNWGTVPLWRVQEHWRKMHFMHWWVAGVP